VDPRKNSQVKMVRTVRTADPRVRNDSGHFRFTASRSYPSQAHSGHTGSRSVHFTPRTDDCRDRVTIFDRVQPLVHHGLINRPRFLRYEILLQTIKPAAGSKRRRSAPSDLIFVHWLRLQHLHAVPQRGRRGLLIELAPRKDSGWSCCPSNTVAAARILRPWRRG
jgi:hypothetical protein